MRALKRKRINYLRRKLILLQNIIAVVFSSLIRWFPCVGLVRTFYRWLKNNDSLLFSYLKNLDNRHGQIETNGAFTSLADDINKLVENVLREIAEDDDRFKGNVIPTGSFFQGSKLEYPDEFDYTFILTELSSYVNHNCTIQTKDHATVHLVASTKTSHLCDKWENVMENGVIKIELVIALFIKALEKKITEMTGRAKHFMKFGCLIGIKSSVIFCSGPSVSFNLTFDSFKVGGKFMRVNVDICLAVALEESVLNRCRKLSYEACLNFPLDVTKMPLIVVFHPSYDSVISSALIEHQLLTNSHPSVKMALRVMKIFKEHHLPISERQIKATLGRPKSLLTDKAHNKDFAKGLHSVDMKTYVLKTILYREMAKNPYNFQWLGENFNERIIHMIETVIYSLKTELTEYFLPDKYVLHNYIFLNPTNRDQAIADFTTLLANINGLRNGKIKAKMAIEDRIRFQQQHLAELYPNI